MQIVRRLYLYLMSGITLGVLAVGLRMALAVLFDAIGLGRGSFIIGDPSADRQQLSLAVALIGVGLPVWAIHWWLAERGLRPGTTHAQAERGSAVRAFYLTLTLAVLLAIGATAGAELLRGVIQGVLGDRPDFATADLAGSLATVLVTGVAWGYHVAIRRRDMGGDPLTGAAAWLPRVYLYGAALLGLLVLLQSFGDLVTIIGEAVVPQTGAVVEPGMGSSQAGGSLSAIIISGAIWLGHWWYARGLVRSTGWRGASEGPATLRLAYFVGVVIFSAFSAIRLVAAALSAVLAPLFGASTISGESVAGRDVARVLGVALVSAVPWALAWWFHRRSMAREAILSNDPGRISTTIRLDLHSAALVGLGFGGVGLAWLLGLLVDVVLGGDRTVAGSLWRTELSTFLPLALIGSAVWLSWWWRIQARRAADAPGEAPSTVRRSYLMIILAASVIASLSSMALILYRLFGTILGANLGGNAASELSTPIGALVVAGAIALYHGQALRRDMAVRAAEAAPEGPSTGSAEAGRRLLLVGPTGSDLDATVAGLRADLPAGYRLDDG